MCIWHLITILYILVRVYKIVKKKCLSFPGDLRQFLITSPRKLTACGVHKVLHFSVPSDAMKIKQISI